MKNILLFAFGLILSLNVIAQTWYSEDFETVTPPAFPANITSVDVDGDGFEWGSFAASGQVPWTNNGNVAASMSYDNTAGPLTPDNHLVIGPIDLSSSSSAATMALEWEAAATEATSSGWYQEHYSVYMETSTTPGTALYSETLAAGQVLYSRTVDVSSFIGNSSVYIIFRHHNCTDEWRLGIDNIAVKTLVDDDAGVTAITTSAISLLSSGTQLITGEITNFGGNVMTSVDINYSIDGGATNTQSLTGLSIAAGGTYNFSHSSSWTPAGIGCYDLDVWTSNVNAGTDANPSNDHLMQVLSIVNQSLTTLPLYENFTSNTCGPCASFNPGFQSFINSNSVNDPTSASVANIKYQMDWPGAADQSWNSDGDTRRAYYGVGGIPDHYIDGESGNYSQSELNTHAARAAYMGINATTTIVGNTITVDVTVDPIACYGGSNLKLHIAVTENSYSNSAGTNGETQFHQVMRKMLPSANGTSIGPLSAGVPVTVSESYTFTVGGVAAGNFNLWSGLSNTTVIVFVQDDDTEQVLQTAIGVEGCGAAAPSVSATPTDASCSGVADGSIDITVSGGAAPYNFSWSTGATTEDITGLVAGTYTVVITDANNCVTTQSVTVNDGGSVSISTTATDASCGASDGTATATATGGASPYNYLWDAAAANQTTQTATGLAAGTYTVTATDANGCTSVGTVTVVSSGGVSVSTTATDANCGASDGTATATATGGASPYNYLWDAAAANQTTQTATGLAAGMYSVTATDANGCTSVASVTVNAGGTGPALTTTLTDATCNGGSDGTATVTPTGGTAPYVYAWSDGQTASTATGLAAGSYTVVVTDVNGCSSNSIVVIIEPSLIVATTTSTQPGCGASDGTSTVTATGGVSPYVYAWSDGQTAATATGLAAGTYTVDITDANGCTVTETVNLSNAGAGTLTNVAVDVTCNGLSDGSITTTFTGGTGTINYAWSTGMATSSLSGLTAGTYTVTVTDDNNCIVTESIVINEPDAIVVDMTYQNVSSPSSCDGTATATVTGGTSPYAYLWDDPAMQTMQTAVGLCVGAYSVMITDANGCSSTGSVMVDSIAMGVSNISIGSINVFPNPTNGAFTIEFDVPAVQAGKLQIVAVDGRIVYQESVMIYPGYRKAISLDDEAKGVYFISMVSEGMVLNRKVIIR